MTVLPALPSTVPAVVTNLFTLLAATPAMVGVDIGWGGPVESAPDELVSVSVTNHVVSTAAIGSQRRTEEYDLELAISVIQSDPEGFNPFQRASTLRDAIASVVRADATINGAVMWCLDIGGEDIDRGDGKRSESQMTLRLHCYARI